MTRINSVQRKHRRPASNFFLLIVSGIAASVALVMSDVALAGGTVLRKQAITCGGVLSACPRRL